jgi:hypothetical protein
MSVSESGVVGSKNQGILEREIRAIEFSVVTLHGGNVRACRSCVSRRIKREVRPDMVNWKVDLVVDPASL